jgi:membrane protein required for colicin V production
MSTADVTILVIIGLSIALGLWRGLVKEVLSLVAWILAFWAALTLSAPLAAFLGRFIDSPAARGALAFCLLFITVLLIGALITHLANKALAGSGLGGLDRLFGGLFGLVRGFAIVVVLLTAASFFPVQDAGWYRASSLAPQLAPYVAWVRSHLSDPPRAPLST